jgi:hypothetical protein
VNNTFDVVDAPAEDRGIEDGYHRRISFSGKKWNVVVKEVSQACGQFHKTFSV